MLGASRGRRELRFVGQLALIVGAFVAYMAVRAVANDAPSNAMSNAHDLLGFEQVLGLDLERRAQRFALDRPQLIEFFNVVYAWTYWPLLIGTFVYTWIRRRDLFVVYRNAIFLSGALGLVIFVFYPVAPPRFLDGFVDTIDAADRSYVIAHPSLIINRFAALPSFHVGWVTLACVVIAMTITHRPARLLLALPPTLMATAVVVTGNHFIIDAIAGIALSLLGLAAAHRRKRQAGLATVAAETDAVGTTATMADVACRGRGTVHVTYLTLERRLPIAQLTMAGKIEGCSPCRTPTASVGRLRRWNDRHLDCARHSPVFGCPRSMLGLLVDPLTV